ncbi:MAG TPA: hypothetical protein VNE17_08225 [Nitrolancea sp.]|nr:hypothetical protein [Nitrolancea sp.]
MQTAEARSEPTFAGSKKDQANAIDTLNVIRATGRFFPKSAPLRASISSLGAYFASTHGERSAEEWSTYLEKIVKLNPDVFLLEQIDDVAYLVTTYDGVAPVPQVVDESHLLAERFAAPRPIPVAQLEARKRARVAQLAQAEASELVGGPSVEVVDDEMDEVELGAAEDLLVASAEVPVIAEEQREEPTAIVTDVSDLSDEILAQVIANQLRDEVSVANFGDEWMIEEKVSRLSRGDLRRTREYLIERNEPLTDEVLLQDVLGLRPNAENFSAMKFVLNYRLSREQREFEYVGTAEQRFWSTTGLPVIGTTKRKASEIGQDYRYLLNEASVALPAGENVVEHVLSFYEYQYGVLPLDGVLSALLPSPEIPDQRAAILVFESPQTYETFFAELRFPTANRGGYIAGLDRFFLENLVPGALFTIERNENDGRYLIEYLPVSGEDRKLLQVDEKRGRYVFRPMTFYCATQEDMVLSENRFPQFANVPLLEERIRRRPELALSATFERIGEQVGSSDAPKFMAILDDLVPACNVERPMSADLIRSLITSLDFPAFSTDPDIEDVFYYEPAKS